MMTTQHQDIYPVIAAWHRGDPNTAKMLKALTPEQRREVMERFGWRPGWVPTMTGYEEVAK
jgi:hypothetical protein